MGRQNGRMLVLAAVAAVAVLAMCAAADTEPSSSSSSSGEAATESRGAPTSSSPGLPFPLLLSQARRAAERTFASAGMGGLMETLQGYMAPLEEYIAPLEGYVAPLQNSAPRVKYDVNAAARGMRNIISRAGDAMHNMMSMTDTFINENIMGNRAPLSRRQCTIDVEEFPCASTGPSKYAPTSVHQLKPADIKVVAALGDSMTQGVNALTKSVFSRNTNYPGVSFSIGGYGDWRYFVTLPNLLKNFQPALYGFDEFNMASSGSSSRDLVGQARALVDKMWADPNVDVENDWKMVTIFIGHDDLCSVSCNQAAGRSPADSYHEYVVNVATALDWLHASLPRTFVNLVPMMDLSKLYDMEPKPPHCSLFNALTCPCLFGLSQELNKTSANAIVNDYVHSLEDLIKTARYETEEDFTVVIQPITTQLDIPRTYDGAMDQSYLATDCFHFSQKTHALVARGLWNNLFEPAGHKSVSYTEGDALLCPTKASPYIATYQNSDPATYTRNQLEADYADKIQRRQYGGCTL